MLLVVIGYLSLTLLLALFSTRRAKDITDFLLAGRRLGYFFLVPLFMAELVGGASTVGMSELAYKIGISSAWFNLSMALGCILVASLVAIWYRRSGVTTVPEAFSKLFDQRSRIMVSALFVVVYFVLFTVEISALAAIISPLFRLSPPKSQLLVDGVFLLLTATAGLWTVAWTNILHTLAIYMGMLLALYYALGAAGGWGIVVKTLPPNYFNPLGLGPFRILAWLLGLPLAFVVSQPMIQSVVSAWDPGKAKRAVMMAGLFITLLALVVALTGMAGRIAFPHVIPRQVLFEIARLAPPPIGGLILSGILAALLSTAPILLLALSTIVKRDFLDLFFPNFSRKADVWAVRGTMVVACVLALVLVSKVKFILGTLMDAFQIRAVVGIVFLAGLYWKGMDAPRAFWTMCIGGGGGILWVAIGKPMGLEPLYFSLILSGLTLLFLSLVSPSKD